MAEETQSAARPPIDEALVPDFRSFAPSYRERVDMPAAGVAVGSNGLRVLYTPLHVTVGDGLKFGCGFFAASLLVMFLALLVGAALLVTGHLPEFKLPLWP